MTDLILLFKAAFLGLVEGVTEFIPVSSTGHLIIAGDLLNWTDQRANTFIIFIQLPAILAVLWVYREKVWHVLSTLRSREESRRLVYNLVIGTLPAVVIGLPTDRWIEAHLFNPIAVSTALIIGGLLIFWIERSRHHVRVAEVDDLPIKLALGIGVIQVLAVIFPGISRSGATIMGGMVLGLSRLAATEFSFFLAIPAMFGATGVKLWEARHLLSVADVPVFALGGLVSFISALLVIRGLLRLVSRHSFRGFAWYRIAFGLLILALYWNATWTS